MTIAFPKYTERISFARNHWRKLSKKQSASNVSDVPPTLWLEPPQAEILRPPDQARVGCPAGVGLAGRIENPVSGMTADLADKHFDAVDGALASWDGSLPFGKREENHYGIDKAISVPTKASSGSQSAERVANSVMHLATAPSAASWLAPITLGSARGLRECLGGGPLSRPPRLTVGTFVFAHHESSCAQSRCNLLRTLEDRGSAKHRHADRSHLLDVLSARQVRSEPHVRPTENNRLRIHRGVEVRASRHIGQEAVAWPRRTRSRQRFGPLRWW